MANFDDTRVLLGAFERVHKPGRLLTDTFFSDEKTFTTEYVDIEYREKGRKMAPFVVPGGAGVNITRAGSVMRTYKAPLMKPQMPITPYDVAARGFGESITSTKTPEERAIEMRADDMLTLGDTILRRQEWMAAQLLVNGGYDIEGYADDGNTTKIDTLSFDSWASDHKLVLSGTDAWDQTTATPYDVLVQMSHKIAKDADEVPTVAICSASTARLLLNNAQIKELMMIPNRDTAALLAIQPQIVSNDVRRVGYIDGLNLDIYEYASGYDNEAGEFVPYIPDNTLIMGIKGFGHRLYGAVTQLESDGKFHTYEGRMVPKVINDMAKDTSTMTMSCRCIFVPTTISDWMTVKVK